MDNTGITGWERIDELADALISINGLSVTRADAERIIKCYNNLSQYDKRPLMFTPQVNRLDKSKKKTTGHTTVEMIRRLPLY